MYPYISYTKNTRYETITLQKLRFVVRDSEHPGSRLGFLHTILSKTE